MKEKQDVDVIDVDADVEEHLPAVIDARPDAIMAKIDVSDYAQFLYQAGTGRNAYTDFNAEGIKTLALNHGISTSPVQIEFLNEEKTEALFYCTATDRNGDTSSIVVSGSKHEYGKENRYWIEKHQTRAIAKAQRARLPVQLLKAKLQQAIAAGEAEKSEIMKAQDRCTEAYNNRENDGRSKRNLLEIAENEWGLSNDQWDSHLWDRFAQALSGDFDKEIQNGTT